MESLLQYYKQDAVTRRSMALSRKKNEVVPSELVDCDHSFVDRSTGSTEVFRNMSIRYTNFKSNN